MACLISSLLQSTINAASRPAIQAGTFACDVTPPVGHPLCGGWIKPLEAVDAPLLAKGIVLANGDERYVLCAVDWCLLQTTALDLFTQKIAKAAGIPARQVAVHTVHQHNAPIADKRAQELLNSSGLVLPHLDLDFLEQVTDRVASAVRNACQRLQPVSHVGFGRAKVAQFASNRRVRLADGAIHVRYSSMRDPIMQKAAEGLIDPWLRTVTLFQEDRPLVRLHYYTSHPMSYYGDGRATADTVGLAREQLQREEGVFQVYFTGCGGNITAGKYNQGTPTNRVQLTERIHTAMQQAVATTKRMPVQSLKWRTTPVEFAPRKETNWMRDVIYKKLIDNNLAPSIRLNAALDLAWDERLRANPRVLLSCLTLGPVKLLHLPGETFVEYQLYAQSLQPENFIAVAAYGECGTGYICTDAALTEGGYEPTMSRVGPPSEVNLKQGIAKLLAPNKKSATPFHPAKHDLLWLRNSAGYEHPIKIIGDWERRRQQILKAKEQVLGTQPAKSRLPLDLEILEEVSSSSHLRRKITYVSEAGDRVPAYLFMPKGPGQRRPAVLCLHPTAPGGKAVVAGLAAGSSRHYGLELAERGYVVLAPDYPNFGDYQCDVYRMGYASATMKAIVNHRRAVDLLATLTEVDPRRIGVIGHSLGGHNALFLAAFEPRIQVVVTSCGFNSFYKYYHGDLTGWSHAGYMPRIAAVYGCDPKQMPFDFTEVLAALAPRPVFINAPLRDDNFEISGVKDCVAAATPVYTLYQAPHHLAAYYPDDVHEFPAEARAKAYAWLDQWLK